MDETGRYRDEPMAAEPMFVADALPSASNMPHKPEIRRVPEPVKEAKEENASVGPISILYTMLLDTVFRFKEPEEKSLLKLLCDSINKQSPDLKLDIGELIEMYYDLDDRTDDMNQIIAQSLRRHIVEVPEVPLIEPDMETDSAAPAPNTSNTVTADNRQREQRLKDLKPELICKVCFDNEVAVTFVPCGHLVTCVSCTAALFECPVCRTHIRGTIRTYI